MVLSQDLKEILNNYDFTDSIINCIKWENDLLDLVIGIDYYWDIQQGRNTSRILNLTFKNCLHAEFNNTRNILTNDTELVANATSWFTIVKVKNITETMILDEYSKNIAAGVEIYTFDYSKPWLTVIFSEVILEGEE